MMTSKLKTMKNQFKKLNAVTTKQAEKEKEQLQSKLLSYGLITPGAPLDTVLGLEINDLMERRLQTILVRKNLARSVNQARQFIVHRHIIINGKKVTSPSHLVKLGEEGSISFVQTSRLADPNHPERHQEIPKGKEDKKKKDSKNAEEEIASFEEVPKNEEEILKEMAVKPSESKDDKVDEDTVKAKEEAKDDKVDENPVKDKEESKEKAEEEK